MRRLKIKQYSNYVIENMKIKLISDCKDKTPYYRRFEKKQKYQNYNKGS